MSQISTRSRAGSTAKTTAVPKPRKKVAPKVVSARPKKKNGTSQIDQGPPADKTTQSTSPEPVEHITAATILPPPLANEITVISTLTHNNDNIPLPTLPCEEAPNGLSTSLHLPLPSEADICTDVSDLFADQHSRSSADQDGGIGEELLNLSHSSSNTVLERTLDAVNEARVESTEAAVSNCCPGNKSEDITRSESVSSPEAVSPVSGKGVPDVVGEVTGEDVSNGMGGVMGGDVSNSVTGVTGGDVPGSVGGSTGGDVLSGGQATEEESVNSQRPHPKTTRKVSLENSN